MLMKHLYFPVRDVLGYIEKSEFIFKCFNAKIHKQYSMDPKMLSSFGTQDSSKITINSNNVSFHFLGYL